MGKITIAELVDRANGYQYGLAGYDIPTDQSG